MFQKKSNGKYFWFVGIFLLVTLALGLGGCGDITAPAIPTATILPVTPTAVVSITPISQTTSPAASPSTPATTTSPAEATSVKLERKAFTVDLDGFSSKAELTYPAQGTGPFPTLVMFTGAGIWDLDGTYQGFNGQSSANFKLTAEYLSSRGFAVVRFNKRGVKGPGQIDQAVFAKNTIKSYIADGSKVIEATKQFTQVDQHKLILYGWSEGAIVASHLAAMYPELAGIVLQAAPAGGYKEAFTYQMLELGLPYATRFDQDKDGALTLDEIMAGFTSGAGNGFSVLGNFLFDSSSSPQKPVLSKTTDSDGNGKIDLEKELKPAIEAYLAGFDKMAAASPDYMGFDKTLGSVPQALSKFSHPVLLLQGQNDGLVKADNATSIAQTLRAGNSNVSVKLYNGLGHSLSKVSEAAGDTFGPEDLAPLADLAEWLGQFKA